MHKKYIAKIIEKGSKVDIEKLSDFLCETMDHIKECDRSLYDRIEIKMYEMAYGKTLTEEMASTWVHSMKPAGMKWTKIQTDELIKKYNLALNDVDFWAIMNAMYNDYYKTFDDEIETYIKLARDFIKDEDAIEGKVYEYWKCISKK